MAEEAVGRSSSHYRERDGASGRTVQPPQGVFKGVVPAVPIIISGLTTGNDEQRKNADYAARDLVERTEESVMAPFVLPFTGPPICAAIQVASYLADVNTAVLPALVAMLERIPNHAKLRDGSIRSTVVHDGCSSIIRIRHE